MALHTLQCPNALRRCLQAVSRHDVVLLIDRAIYLADASSKLWKTPLPCPVFALQEDMATSGITSCAEQVRLVDYHQWVDLTIDHQPHIAWY